MWKAIKNLMKKILVKIHLIILRILQIGGIAELILFIIPDISGILSKIASRNALYSLLKRMYSIHASRS